MKDLSLFRAFLIPVQIHLTLFVWGWFSLSIKQRKNRTTYQRLTFPPLRFTKTKQKKNFLIKLLFYHQLIHVRNLILVLVLNQSLCRKLHCISNFFGGFSIVLACAFVAGEDKPPFLSTWRNGQNLKAILFIDYLPLSIDKTYLLRLIWSSFQFCWERVSSRTFCQFETTDAVYVDYLRLMWLYAWLGFYH